MYAWLSVLCTENLKALFRAKFCNDYCGDKRRKDMGTNVKKMVHWERSLGRISKRWVSLGMIICLWKFINKDYLPRMGRSLGLVEEWLGQKEWILGILGKRLSWSGKKRKLNLMVGT